MCRAYNVAPQDAAANLTISSPLEAHKQRAIIHSIIGVDVGFENPLFAALEVDYGESDQDHTGEAFNSAEKVSSVVRHDHDSVLMTASHADANVL